MSLTNKKIVIALTKLVDPNTTADLAEEDLRILYKKLSNILTVENEKIRLKEQYFERVKNLADLLKDSSRPLEKTKKLCNKFVRPYKPLRSFYDYIEFYVLQETNSNKIIVNDRPKNPQKKRKLADLKSEDNKNSEVVSGFNIYAILEDPNSIIPKIPLPIPVRQPTEQLEELEEPSTENVLKHRKIESTSTDLGIQIDMHPNYLEQNCDEILQQLVKEVNEISLLEIQQLLKNEKFSPSDIYNKLANEHPEELKLLKSKENPNSTWAGYYTQAIFAAITNKLNDLKTQGLIKRLPTKTMNELLSLGEYSLSDNLKQILHETDHSSESSASV